MKEMNDYNYLIKWVKCRGIEVILHSPRGKDGQGIGRKPPTTQYGFLPEDKSVDVLIRVDKSNGRVSVSCPYFQEVNSGRHSLRGSCAINNINKPTCLYLKNRFYIKEHYKIN